jgi:ABC-2 type transport system permease protein
MRIWNKPWKNPVIVKDFRTRMRGNRAFILLTAHLLILGSLAFLVYILLVSSMSPRGALDERRIFGKAIFGLLVGMEMVMISFVAPALTSGAISTERERQTYDLLRVTLLTPRSLVMGKYLSGLVFIFLLLFTSLPLQSPAFLLGGLLPEEILIATLILAVTAIAFCAVGIFTSSIFSRTLISTVLSYAFAIFLVFGVPIILVVFLILFNTSIENVVEHLPWIWQAILLGAAWLLLSITPFGTIVASEVILLDESSILYATISLTSKLELVLPSPWLIYTPIYLLFSGLLLWLSVRRVSMLEK